MIIKRLNSGFKMPALGIGTYGMGGDEQDEDKSNDAECITAIRDALNLGYTHIDTAEVYGSGHTEELVGKAIEDYDRKKLFIATKVFKTNLKYDDVIRSAKGSLKRMKIDYIDLCLIHSYNPDVPIKETISAMDGLVKKGLIKHIGVCNFSIEQLKEAQKYSMNKIVTNQMKYSLWAKTGPDLETIDYCQKNDIMVTAYKLFGRGKINTEKIPIFSVLAKKYNKTEAQIITNWVVSKKNVVTIFKSVNKEHLKENLEALEFQIDDKNIQELDSFLLKK